MCFTIVSRVHRSISVQHVAYLRSLSLLCASKRVVLVSPRRDFFLSFVNFLTG